MILAEPSLAAAQPSERKALFECLRLTRFEAALEQARQLTRRYPQDALGWKVLGTLLVHQGDHEAAWPALEEARRLDPRDAETLNSLGQALQGLTRSDEALDVYHEALHLQPASAEFWHNHALILHGMGRLEEALAGYDQAVRINPAYAKAHYNRGSLLSDLGRPDDALLAYEQALVIKPDSAESFNLRALALLDLGRLAEALASLDRALELQPNFAAALSNRGGALKDLGRLDEAITSYDRALSLQPSLIAAWQSRLLCLNYRADLTPEKLFTEHRAFDAYLTSQFEPLPPDTTRDRNPERRLRLGFVSGDFHQHSVAFFLRPVLEHLDHDRFEVFCYAMSLKQDDWTHDFRRLADVWVESATMTPEALAERIRADAIDLLVDLSGHTKHNALQALMAKPAPIQITWIGYPNTTGLSSLDYRLVDAITDPPGTADTTHSECLIRLPRGFLCYRPRASEEALPLAPAPCLERGFVTFASFNNLAKITPATLDLWSEILTAVPGSRLRLKSNQAADSHVWDRILEHFAAQGIAPERLERLPRAADHLDHLALYRDVDIALDTYPYHGTTTTCEALFMGVPVITLAGDRHAARVGASLLTRVGLTDLIADSPQDYVRLAVDLAQDHARLRELHAGLRARLKASPLRDEAGFTRILESALRQMWRLWCAGESPRVFEVESPSEQSVLQDVGRERQTPHAAVPVAPKVKRAGRKKNKRQGKSKCKAKTKKYPTDTALTSADVAEPSQPPSELRIALMLFRHGHFERAASQARRFTERHPAEIFGWKLLGTSLVKACHFEEALEPLLEAVRIKPQDAENINTLGFALMSLGRLDEAIGCYKRAIEIYPDYPIAYNNLGTVYSDRAQFDRAIACYDQALELDPEYPEAHLNRGVVLGELGWLEQSVTCYQRALELQPTSVATLNNLGKSEMMLGHLDAAQRAYRRALELQPDLSQSFSNLLLCLNYEAGLAREQVFDEHRAFESTQTSRITRLPPLAHQGQDPERPLRLGFVSGDLRFHSVAYFLLPVLEQLDRERFQVFCYSRSHRQDEVTQVFRGLADTWLDCPAMPEQELAERIRADGIDLLFDLSGHTGASALRAFAAKPAPVQITWIGYPNTTGLSTMDYRLVDALTDPPGEADTYHTERLIRLPSGFLCYRPWSTGFDLPVTVPPCLEAGHITFGSFNNLSKITPATLDLWVEVMRAVPNARLLLKSHTASDIQVWNRLVTSFESAGIAPERLEFLPRAPSYTEHLKQYSRLDIALDTYPYHGTTTTCEALFMGVPVVTLAGDRHAARVGVSLLNQAGLPEFVAHSSEDYVAVAVHWSADPNLLSDLRAGSRERLELSPLRDEVRFTRTLEAVLRQMWRLWCAGESAQRFDVIDTSVEPTELENVEKKSLKSSCLIDLISCGIPKRLKTRRPDGNKATKPSTDSDQILLPSLTEQKTLIALFNQGYYPAAEEKARHLIEKFPKDIFGWKILGAVFVKTNRHEAAIPVLLEANRLSPEDSECINTLGSALQNLGRLDEAFTCFRRAIEINPSYALAHNNLGAALSDLGRIQESLNCYGQALKIAPKSAEFYCNQGLALHLLGRTMEALASFDQALKYAPNNVDVLNKRGILLENLGRYEEALTSYDKALAIKPEMADALNNRGSVLKNFGLLKEAYACYSKALCIQPDLREAWHNRLLCMNYDLDFSREEVFESHQDFDRQRASKIIRLPSLKNLDTNPDRRLRLGLVSGDFRQHSVAFFLKPILENLDRHCFEVFCYTTSHRRDRITDAFQEIADQWVEAAKLGARALANRIRFDGVDILIDLSGHTEDNALLAFAARPAPVQITWIGYPNTTGLSTMDYRLVDAVTDPPGESDAYHSECLIRLPKGFLCYQPPDAGVRLSSGLPPCLKSGVITFGSFNNLAKVTQATLDLWSHVLNAVPDSRLVLKTPTTADVRIWNRVVTEFINRGIAAERLEPLGRAASQEEHFAHYRGIDIALDTYPYHGTTTTCEALCTGVPVITLAGDRHVSRVGASLLTQVNLPELIANSREDYVRIAADLAADRARLTQLRTELCERLERSPLRDEVGFTRNLEMALRQMWRLWCAGEPPQAFDVDAVEMPITIPTESERQGVIQSFEQGELTEAECSARELTVRYPRASFGWKALGTSLARARRSREAIVALRHALALSPDEAETLETLGKVLLDLNRLEEAEDCLRQAVALQPDDAGAHDTLGAVLAARGQLTKAADSYRRALAICPDMAQTLSNLATLLKDLGRVDEALEVYARALELQPQAAAIHSNRLFCLNYHSRLSREQVFVEHLAFQAQQAARIEPLPTVWRDHDPRRRLRLGLVSADFRYHSVAFFIAPVIEHLDRQAFELVCYSRSHQRDAITESFERRASVWRACVDLSDAELARLIRADGIDILIDLSGHSRGNALPAFAARPAPVQVSWIGYPNTTGLAAMDYRLVDDLTDPPGEADGYHSERLIRLPKGFLCYRPLIRGDELPVGVPPSRELGYVTFGSFNALGKISPVTLELWSAVLGAVPESRLMLKSSLAADGDAWDRVIEHFRARGVDPRRLEILPCSGSHKAHLERYREIDIALDTYPYHGTTTTCEALFMGVPVVTLTGDCHAARVGVSLLSRVGLTELIASSPEEYAQIALRLASEPEHLNLLRATLRERLECSPLRDEIGFTRTLEMALQQMWDHQIGAHR